MLGDANFRNSGFLSRCLILTLPRVKRDYSTGGYNPKVLQEWNTLVQSLASIPVPLDGNKHVCPLPVSVEPEAYAWFMKVHVQEQSDRLYDRHAEFSDDQNEWATRFWNQTLRLAGLLHLVRHRVDYHKHPICRDDLMAAGKFYRYYFRQFELTMGVGKQSTTDANLSKLMAWALKQESFTKSEAVHNVRCEGEDKYNTRTKLITLAIQHGSEKGWLDYNAATKRYHVTDKYRGSQKGKGE